MLYQSAGYNKLNVLRGLLEEGANTELTEPEYGDVPLHAAAAMGFGNVIDELHAYGADVNPLNKKGMTPLYLAAFSGRANMVKRLLTKGAIPDL
ncbi:unnamed protein product, partial [marine sediment metagenome]